MTGEFGDIARRLADQDMAVQVMLLMQEVLNLGRSDAVTSRKVTRAKTSAAACGQGQEYGGESAEGLEKSIGKPDAATARDHRTIAGEASPCIRQPSR